MFSHPFLTNVISKWYVLWPRRNFHYQSRQLFSLTRSFRTPCCDCKRFAQSQSKSRKSDKKLLTEGAKQENYAAYFLGISAIIIISVYINKERQKKREKEHFESKFEQRQAAGLLKTVHYGGYLLPEFVKRTLKEVKDFPLRDTDILVVSFPKSGTTWIQEVVYKIERGLATEPSSNMEERFPYLEYVYPGLSEIKKVEGVRLLKSHLPYNLLPDDIRLHKAKIIYIYRNPKDVAVSYYHFARMFTEVKYRGTFEEFFNMFISNEVPYGPWWNHVADFYLHKNDPNVLILSYEDLKKNPVKVIGQVGVFLGKELSEEEKQHIASMTSFRNMSANPKSNYSWWDELGLRDQHEAPFLRKGEVGDWHNYFDEAMSEKMDTIVQKYLHPLGLSVKDDIAK